MRDMDMPPTCAVCGREVVGQGDDVLVLQVYEEGSHRFACRLGVDGGVELYDELFIGEKWRRL